MQVAKFNTEMKTLDRGYDGKGRPLPGREVNMRKNPNGPAARRPGDMLKPLKEGDVLQKLDGLKDIKLRD